MSPNVLLVGFPVSRIYIYTYILQDICIYIIYDHIYTPTAREWQQAGAKLSMLF